MSYRRLAGVQSTPRVMRGAPVRNGSMFDMPLIERNLDGLGWWFGAAPAQPAPPAQAAPAQPAPATEAPAPASTVVVQPGSRITAPAPKPPTKPAAHGFGSMSKTTMLIAGLGAVGAVGLVYYLVKHR